MVEATAKLLLDSSIRMWVVPPIIFITFLMGVLHHYISQLLRSNQKMDLKQLSDRIETKVSRADNHPLSPLCHRDTGNDLIKKIALNGTQTRVSRHDNQQLPPTHWLQAGRI
ncbi:unnamed protein product [Merluccius merluccius]